VTGTIAIRGVPVGAATPKSVPRPNDEELAVIRAAVSGYVAEISTDALVLTDVDGVPGTVVRVDLRDVRPQEGAAPIEPIVAGDHVAVLVAERVTGGIRAKAIAPIYEVITTTIRRFDENTISASDARASTISLTSRTRWDRSQALSVGERVVVRASYNRDRSAFTAAEVS